MKKLKLLLTTISSTIVLSTMPIILASCSTKDDIPSIDVPTEETLTNEQRVFRNLKNTILNKAKASFTLPSSVNNENIANFIELDNFDPIKNYGYRLGYPEVINNSYNDKNGTLKLKITIIKGNNHKIENIIEFDGFLTTNAQIVNNDNAVKNVLNDLGINETKNKLEIKLDRSWNNLSIHDAKNISLFELIQPKKDAGALKTAISPTAQTLIKNINLIPKLKSTGNVKLISNSEVPILTQKLYIETENGNSSAFELEIHGFSANLNINDVKNIISTGYAFNNSKLQYMFASEFDTKTAENLFIKNLNNVGLATLFRNYKDITIKFIKINGFNNKSGMVNVTFSIDMGNNTTPELFTTDIFGFASGETNETLLLMGAQLFQNANHEIMVELSGRNLPTENNNSNKQYILEINNKIVDNYEVVYKENWKQTKLIFKLPPTIEVTNDSVVKVSLSNDKTVWVKNTGIETRIEVNATQDLNNLLASKYELIETAFLSKQLITSEWIIKNKYSLLTGNTNLLNSSDDISDLKVTTFIEPHSNIATSLNVSFEIVAGSSYNDMGELTTKNKVIQFKLTGFQKYASSELLKSEFDAREFDNSENHKFSELTAAIARNYIDSTWVFNNKNLFFTDIPLITSKWDISVEWINQQNLYKPSDVNRTLNFNIRLKSGKSYNSDGSLTTQDAIFPVVIKNFKDFKSLEVKQDVFNASLFNMNETAEINRQNINRSWILNPDNKNIIFDPLSTSLIQNEDDIINVTTEVQSEDKDVILVTLTIKAGKSYQTNGSLTTFDTTVEFWISNSKKFQAPKLKINDYVAYEFNEFARDKTAKQNEPNITKEWFFKKIKENRKFVFEDRNPFFHPLATQLIESPNDIMDFQLTYEKENVNDKDYTIVKVETGFLANKTYLENGSLNPQPFLFSFRLHGFRHYETITPSTINTQFTANDMGYTGTAKIVSNSQIDNDNFFIKLKDPNLILKSTQSFLIQNHSTDIVINNLKLGTDKRSLSFELVIKAGKWYAENGSPSTTDFTTTININNFDDFTPITSKNNVDASIFNLNSIDASTASNIINNDWVDSNITKLLNGVDSSIQYLISAKITNKSVSGNSITLTFTIDKDYVYDEDGGRPVNNPSFTVKINNFKI